MEPGQRPLGVSHVRRTADAAVPRLLTPDCHLLHVAFHNRITASEKRIGGGPLLRHAGPVVGRAMLLPAGTDLWGWSRGEVDFLRIEVDPARVAAALTDRGHPERMGLRPRVQHEDAVLWHLASALRADSEAGCPGGWLFRDGIHDAIAGQLARQACHDSSAAVVGALSPRRLREVRAFVRANLGGEIRLADLAAVASMSTFHFARAFRAATGVPPYRYVVAERLAYAVRLLEGTDLTIAGIATAVGFQTGTGFAAAFRRAYGVSAGAFRRVVRDD